MSLSTITDALSRALRLLRGGLTPGVTAALLLSNAATAAFLLHALSGGAPLKALRRLLFLAALAAVPASLVSNELSKIKRKMERDLIGSSLEGETLVLALPARGWPAAEAAAAVVRYGDKDRALWGSGRISGCVYHGGEALADLMASAFRAFAIANPLHPDVFPSLRKVRRQRRSARAAAAAAAAAAAPLPPSPPSIPPALRAPCRWKPRSSP
jgi:hypothetical protein